MEETSKSNKSAFMNSVCPGTFFWKFYFLSILNPFDGSVCCKILIFCFNIFICAFSLKKKIAENNILLSSF